jgi:hypothetical protein
MQSAEEQAVDRGVYRAVSLRLRKDIVCKWNTVSCNAVVIRNLARVVLLHSVEACCWCYECTTIWIDRTRLSPLIRTIITTYPSFRIGSDLQSVPCMSTPPPPQLLIYLHSRDGTRAEINPSVRFHVSHTYDSLDGALNGAYSCDYPAYLRAQPHDIWSDVSDNARLIQLRIQI